MVNWIGFKLFEEHFRKFQEDCSENKFIHFGFKWKSIIVLSIFRAFFYSWSFSRFIFQIFIRGVNDHDKELKWCTRIRKKKSNNLTSAFLMRIQSEFFPLNGWLKLSARIEMKTNLCMYIAVVSVCGWVWCLLIDYIDIRYKNQCSIYASIWLW